MSAFNCRLSTVIWYTINRRQYQHQFGQLALVSICPIYGWESCLTSYTLAPSIVYIRARRVMFVILKAPSLSNSLWFLYCTWCETAKQLGCVCVYLLQEWAGISPEALKHRCLKPSSSICHQRPGGLLEQSCPSLGCSFHVTMLQ